MKVWAKFHRLHEKTRRKFSNFILIYSEVGRNLKIRSIYMPHYENKFKHWMTGAIKRIDHAMRDEAREFADLSRECPKRAKSDIENTKPDSSQESDSTECT